MESKPSDSISGTYYHYTQISSANDKLLVKGYNYNLFNTNFPVINSIYVEARKKNPFRHHRSAIVVLDVVPDPGSQNSPGLAV